ncbi:MULTISPECIES: ABC transporter permease [unclassified Actinomyces]|uniref:ABC transporter permease n=1 Tax=unclassified Actinomyces TaxID=2609248 RepID=UPI002017B391|nr:MULTISPECIES: ABC transporter permease [unclassified Actinomyces]MCL3778678.1 ABC transporter permease [Actinomyces sp. AC-20-1]MCL3790117.1 ABC transporter permease [Actinomyces sp. 187325]MCL3791213.1 ABC transporter permease [Actinomyces sp. 186855]MCL3794480.1 ABC transporter permease [Actinomyces sp. 217892]
MSTRPSFRTTVAVVARREITARFLSKAFIISTLITVLLMLLAVVLGPRIGDIIGGGTDTVAAAPGEAAVLQHVGGVELMEVADAEAARQAVLDESADAAVVPDADSPVGLRVLALSDPPSALVQGLSVSPVVELLDPDAPNPVIRYLLPLGFALVWMTAALGFGMTIAQSVVEEKETRIVEILLASISSTALLTGKILGNSLAALAQIVLTAGAVLLGLAINDEVLPAGDLVAPVLWFVPLFIIGFVMIASMFAAAAALVSRNEDLQSVLQPMMWLIMLPYFGVAFGGSNETFMRVLSYIPFSSPIALPVRIFLGGVSWWEPVVSVALLVATTAAVIVLGARVYDRGLLHTGKAMAWKEALARAS